MSNFNKKILNHQPLIKTNREYLFNGSQNLELNTYVTWGEITPQFDYSDNYDSKNKKFIGEDNSRKAGVRSIFNKYNIVFKSDDVRMGDNVPLIDTPSMRAAIKKNSDCSIKNLVNCSQQGILGAETYDYSDFAYCKYLGRIPNNYMVTLRRFPIPINDYINTPGYNSKNIYPNSGFGNANTGNAGYLPPVSLGCMVTWMGTPGNELENILKYDFSMPFKSVRAELQDNRKSDQKTRLNAFFSAFDPVYQQQVQLGQAGGAVSMFGGSFKNLDSAPYADHLNQKDANKVYGPIDTINDSHMRSDEGLQFNHTFSLTFEYELRAYSNINTRQAMLDLLANILSVTYTSGDFWGGGTRAMGQHMSDLYTNMKCFKTAGGITEFTNSFIDDAQNIFSKANQTVKKNGGVIETLKEIGNSFGGMLIGGLLNKLGRPEKNFLNSILSPAPVGLWHVTVGNPFHPIMSIGNLILEKTTITHTGPLGLDDFPTGLKVTCDLKRAKGRDKRDIEKLYLHGINRIYAPVGKHIEALYKVAPDYKNLNKTLNSTNTDSETLSGVTSNDIMEVNIGQNSNNMLKHFGTGYMKSITLAADEIAYGSQSKKKTETAGKPQ